MAYGTAILLGSLVVILVSVVYLRTQKASPASLGLMLVALALIGLPVWAKINFQFGGFKADFERRLATVEDATTTLAEEVPKVATVAETNRQLAERLVTAAQTQRSLSPNELQVFRERLDRLPHVQVDTLQAIPRRIQRSRGGR